MEKNPNSLFSLINVMSVCWVRSCNQELHANMITKNVANVQGNQRPIYDSATWKVYSLATTFAKVGTWLLGENYFSDDFRN